VTHYQTMSMCNDFPNQRHKHLAFPSNDKLLDWLYTALGTAVCCVCVCVKIFVFQNWAMVGLANIATSVLSTHQNTFELVDNNGNR
jgi:hypothetical protein